MDLHGAGLTDRLEACLFIDVIEAQRIIREIPRPTGYALGRPEVACIGCA